MAKLSTSNMLLTTRKNLIINGAMQFYQRDNSKNLNAGDDGYNTLDRWRYTETGATGATIQQSVDTESPSGFGASMQLDTTVAEAAVGADEFMGFEQRIEAQDCQHLKWGTTEAQDVTLSFWLKSVTKSGYMGIAIRGDDDDSTMIKEVHILAGSWRWYEITFDGRTGGTGINDDAGTGLRVMFSMFAGTNFQSTADVWHNGTAAWTTANCANWCDHADNDLYITGVQLEVGSDATEFEWRPYGYELRLCQRYFEKTWDIETVSAATTSGEVRFVCNRTGSVQELSGSRFQVQKRDTPTVTFKNPNDNSSGEVYNITNAQGDAATVNQQADHGFGRVADNDAGNNVDDRMRYHYTADAEL
jgi:hypothetical protein